MQINEIIVQNYAELPGAVANGAKRLLLASDLTAGGVTPSFGTIAESTNYAHDHGVTISVLVRPRHGEAMYNDAEIKIMDTDLLRIQQLGVDGVVFGALDESGALDEEAMANLVAAAGGMSLGFSTGLNQKPSDLTVDQLNWLSENDFTRVYTPINQELSALQSATTTLVAHQLQLIPTSTSVSTDLAQFQNNGDFTQLAILPEQA